MIEENQELMSISRIRAYVACKLAFPPAYQLVLEFGESMWVPLSAPMKRMVTFLQLQTCWGLLVQQNIEAVFGDKKSPDVGISSERALTLKEFQVHI